ncbi:DUF4856 domain-containing protein [Aquimarina sp. 2201CG14-23]|uniref:DUF4856 domain-containing protein n=1 Tax=Aquimarina mycalae TaxID=3040073 RepID=UPI0024780D04|nr:DUF4856 domain-containing protein [Aquimarina sp. 2201CG14-23]MDH7446969.1 DUF4856 domain-containing protein [Aquimarina sp. 2201CG14-23]
MKFKNTIKINSLLFLGATLMVSCSSDDDAGAPNIDEPATYVFERNGESTVSFSGQTTRIAMAEVIIDELKDNMQTEAVLDAMFDHQEGANDFEDVDLNASTKSVRNKTAASRDFFSANTVNAAAIKADFDGWIKSQVDEVFPNWAITATAGNPGVLQEGGANGANRYVNAKGLELNQAFAKSLIGGLMTDQALNNYLGTAVLDEADNVDNNNNEVVADGESYTTMEHKWDEAYGYLYGASANTASPNATIGDDDSFLNKYIGRVEDDADFAGIAADIYNAFKLGRAAIVAKNYTVRDQQAAIIREKISQVIAVRAVYYLQQGKTALEAGTIDYASAFHDLSEGFGFVYSLQFTRRSDSNTPYFTRTEVQDLIDDLMGGTNGLWDVTPATLQTLSETIAAKFDFTVEQAGS